MSATPPAVAQPEKEPSAFHRLRWVVGGGAALVVVICAGALLAITRSHSAGVSNGATAAVESWPSGVRRAPAFSLTDQNGQAVSLAALRGRPVIVTFIDPLCRNFCPREASVLTDAASQLGRDAPTIVSVSVDPWADTAANFRLDARRWRLASNWRWGTGSYARLARVWKPYGVGVVVTKKRIAGITVREITHTGAAYLIDAEGYERALFLYPFDTAQVVTAAHSILSESS
jgi:cytochrome oxidase Cu insertion factor (SCO1/SenC/PrrC family)